jgi:RNA polymerase sigma factor (sigma-70 family)
MIKTIFAPIREGDYSNPFGADLYNTVSKTVRRMAGKFYSILSDEDVDDLVHDTYLKLLQSQDKADFSLNFDGWVYRACKNGVNSCAKAKSRRNSWIVDLDEDFDDDDAPFDLDRSSVLVDDTYIADRQMLEDEFEQRFWKAVSRLKDDYREVAIMLHEETPYKEMAKELGCTENTVKTKVCRTRQALLKMGVAA